MRAEPSSVPLTLDESGGGEGDGNAHNQNRIRYTGRSDQRALSRNGLIGNNNEPDWGIYWTPGSEVPFAAFLCLAGSMQVCKDVLRAHKHEFEVVGPGAEDLWSEEGEEEEFSVGGQVQ